MNASTLAGVLRPPLTHFAIFTSKVLGCILRVQWSEENYSIR